MTVENAISGDGDDYLLGNDANNDLDAGKGVNVINGGIGTDTATFTGNRSDWTVQDLGGGEWRIYRTDLGNETDTKIVGIENVKFDDGTILISALTADPGPHPPEPVWPTAPSDADTPVAVAAATDPMAAAETAVTTAIAAAANLGTQSQSLDVTIDLNKSIIDSLMTGLGSIVDADMEDVAARSAAIKVQMDLAGQSLNIANGQTQSILSLFR